MPKKARERAAYELKRFTKPGRYFVGGVAGLHLRIRSDKSRSWILRTGVGDKRRDFGLGPYPEVSLQDARKRARAKKEDAEQQKKQEQSATQEPLNQPPAATPKTHALCGIKFRDAARDCHKKKLAEFKAGEDSKHGQQWINTLTTYAFDVIGELDVLEITRSHIKKILDPIWLTKTDTATKVRGRIEETIAYAHAEKSIEGVANPASWIGLKPLLPSPGKIKRRKRKHHAALPWERMSDFMEKLEPDDSPGGRCLKWCIYTTTRNKEARGARWPEIDFEKKEWVIPEERMKVEGSDETPRPHRVPLTEGMIRFLQSLPRTEGTDLLFPGRMNNGAMLSENTLGKIVNRITAKMDGTPKATPHGFRSCFKDWHRNQPGFEDEVSELQLAHINNNNDQTRAAYARDALMPKRRILMKQWVRFIAPKFIKLASTAVAA